jgi:ABC-type multidrug transport system ATPase subunit
VIRVEGVSKRYGAIHAVRELSFEIEPGETFALIGPNGAGKTTTLKMLLGLVRPDTGRIALGPGGRAPHDPSARHELGYVPQRVEFTPGRTVAEVLEFFAALRGLPAAAVEPVLARVGLEAHAKRRASELSGGYTQRLSLGQALLGDPAVLVLDEPTASLDPEATWEFRTLVEQLQREGRTVLLCSHLLGEVERIADRVLIMVDGRRAALERIDELRTRQMRASRLVIDVPGDVEAARAVLAAQGFTHAAAGAGAVSVDAGNGTGPAALEALRAAGVSVRSFEVQRPTLEEIFLEVVRGGR